MVLGKVKYFHINEEIVDKESLLIDTGKLKPVSRLGGITYARTTDAYELPVSDAFSCRCLLSRTCSLASSKSACELLTTSVVLNLPFDVLAETRMEE